MPVPTDPSPLLVLAIETSNPSASTDPSNAPGVALGRWGTGGTEVLATERLRAVSRNEDDLLPALARLFERCSLKPADVDRVCVSIGPGGYTSIRVACAVAKSIAMAGVAARPDGAPVMCVGVPSAISVLAATSTETRARRLAVALAGKDQTAFITVFEPGAIDRGGPFPSGCLMDAEAFSGLDVHTLIADRHLPASIRQSADQRSIPVEEPRFDPAALLRVGARLRAGPSLELLPLYPREPDAVTLWRQRHGSASKPL